MPPRSLTLEELETWRESWDFEAKKAAGKDGNGAVPHDFWPTYSAMANTDGGMIVLGLDERHDGHFVAQGIVEIDRVERDLWNLLENRAKVSANVLGREDVEQRQIDGKTVLIIRIPKATRSKRPIHPSGSWENGTYL